MFKNMQVKVIVWIYFTEERLGPWILCDKGRIGVDEHEDLLYDSLFSLIDDLLEPLEDFETIQIANQNTFIFI